jgi:hypothetical protein
MKWQWPVACLLLGAGAAMAYFAGARDAEAEMHRRQTEIWHDANHTKVGTMDDVPSQRDRDNTPGNAA